MIPNNTIPSRIEERPDLMLVDIPDNPLDNVSPDFKPPKGRDVKFSERFFKIGTASKRAAMSLFLKNKDKISDYLYWYTLSFLWCESEEQADLLTWKRLFNSNRANRATSIMKPNEYQSLQNLPEKVTVYRAVRQGETDCIAYTLSMQRAMNFCHHRNRHILATYEVNKKDIFALFLRRGELEVIVLDSEKVQPTNIMFVDEA